MSKKEKLHIKIEIRSKSGVTWINRDSFDKAIEDLQREKEFERKCQK